MIKTSTLQHAAQSNDQIEREQSTSVKGPRKDVIQNILGFSKALSVEKSKHIGQQETILN